MASERRRSWRRISTSHHSRRMPSGRELAAQRLDRRARGRPVRRRRATPPRASGCRSRASPAHWPPSSSTVEPCAASSAPTASAVSGATWRSSANCAAVRSPSCAARSNPSRRVTLAEFLPAWQGVSATPAGRRGAGRDRRRARRRPLVASTLEARRARRAGRRVPGASMLDELCTAGDVGGWGAGAIGSSDGRVRLCFADQIRSWRRAGSGPIRRPGALHDTVRKLLAGRGGRKLLGPVRAGARRAPPTPSCSPPSGTSSGPARSPTTRPPRCGR